MFIMNPRPKVLKNATYFGQHAGHVIPGSKAMPIPGTDARFLNQPRLRLCLFLNFFNYHILKSNPRSLAHRKTPEHFSNTFARQGQFNQAPCRVRPLAMQIRQAHAPHSTMRPCRQSLRRGRTLCPTLRRVLQHRRRACQGPRPDRNHMRFA